MLYLIYCRLSTRSYGKLTVYQFHPSQAKKHSLQLSPRGYFGIGKHLLILEDVEDIVILL